MKVDWPNDIVGRDSRRTTRAETFLGLAVVALRLMATALEAITYAAGWSPAIARVTGRTRADLLYMPRYSVTVYGGRIHVVDNTDGCVVESFDDVPRAAEFMELLEQATRGP